MWDVNGTKIEMAEGDFGVQLPIEIKGTTFGANDYFLLTIKNRMNGTTLLEKTYHDIQENTIAFELDEAESSLLPVGAYVYSLDWYQSGVLQYNIIPNGVYRVVDKA